MLFVHTNANARFRHFELVCNIDLLTVFVLVAQSSAIGFYRYTVAALINLKDKLFVIHVVYVGVQHHTNIIVPSAGVCGVNEHDFIGVRIVLGFRLKIAARGFLESGIPVYSADRTGTIIGFRIDAQKPQFARLFQETFGTKVRESKASIAASEFTTKFSYARYRHRNTNLAAFRRCNDCTNTRVRDSRAKRIVFLAPIHTRSGLITVVEWHYSLLSPGIGITYKLPLRLQNVASYNIISTHRNCPCKRPIQKELTIYLHTYRRRYTAVWRAFRYTFDNLRKDSYVFNRADKIKTHHRARQCYIGVHLQLAFVGFGTYESRSACDDVPASRIVRSYFDLNHGGL